MKNRRNLIVAFLLCACLIVGIGYAALTDVLDITGSADVNQSAAEEAFNQDIYFTAAVANEASVTGSTASINADNNDKASFTAKGLSSGGDKQTFTFTITNVGDLDAEVTPKISSNTNSTYFNVYSDWAGQAKTLKAGESVTYTVTMELIATPTDTISGSCIIELTAVAGTVTNG